MERIANVLVAATFVSIMALPVSAAEQVCGDLDNNGSVLASDSLALLRFAVGQNVQIGCPAGLHCWDNDADNICSIDEDVNQDLGCDVLDCKSGQGSSHVTVGPAEWQSDKPDVLVRNALSYNRAEFTSGNESDSAVLHLNPSLPGMIAGQKVSLRAVEICWDATATDISFEAAYITATRGTLDAVGASEVIGEIADETIHDERTCKRYEIEPAFDLSGGGLVSVRLLAVWQAGGAKVRLAGTTFELDQTP